MQQCPPCTAILSLRAASWKYWPPAVREYVVVAEHTCEYKPNKNFKPACYYHVCWFQKIGNRQFTKEGNIVLPAQLAGRYCAAAESLSEQWCLLILILENGCGHALDCVQIEQDKGYLGALAKGVRLVLFQDVQDTDLGKQHLGKLAVVPGRTLKGVAPVHESAFGHA